jgi:hypothetical protein
MRGTPYEAARLQTAWLTMASGSGGRSFGDIRFSKSESLYNGFVDTSSSPPNLIEMGPINAVPFRKRDLISFAFNSGA